jgi:hypothetical protein
VVVVVGGVVVVVVGGLLVVVVGGLLVVPVVVGGTTDVVAEVVDVEEHPITDAIKTRLIIIERKTAYLLFTE